MFYADRVGLDRVFERVSAFHRDFGPRWTPAPLLERLARAARRFAAWTVNTPANDRRSRRDVRRREGPAARHRASPAIRTARFAPTRLTHWDRIPSVSRRSWITGPRPRLSAASWRSATLTGAWKRLTYREARTRVRRIAQALLDRRLSTDRTVLILSGNSIEHALLALAAMYAGVPYAPVAPAYSLLVNDHARWASSSTPCDLD